MPVKRIQWPASRQRATKVNIALSLRQLRPEQMRQLYEACVTPVVDCIDRLA